MMLEYLKYHDVTSASYSSYIGYIFIIFQLFVCTFSKYISNRIANVG